MKWVLIPIITEREADDAVVSLVREASRVVFLFVIDQNTAEHVPASFVGSRIRSAEAVVVEFKKKLPKPDVKDFVEWGEWLPKILATTRREQVDEVVLVQSPAAQQLALQLKDRGVKATIIDAAPIQPESGSEKTGQTMPQEANVAPQAGQQEPNPAEKQEQAASSPEPR